MGTEPAAPAGRRAARVVGRISIDGPGRLAVTSVVAAGSRLAPGRCGPTEPGHPSPCSSGYEPTLSSGCRTSPWSISGRSPRSSRRAATPTRRASYRRSGSPFGPMGPSPPREPEATADRPGPGGRRVAVHAGRSRPPPGRSGRLGARPGTARPPGGGPCSTRPVRPLSREPGPASSYARVASVQRSSGPVCSPRPAAGEAARRPARRSRGAAPPPLHPGQGSPLTPKAPPRSSSPPRPGTARSPGGTAPAGGGR